MSCERGCLRGCFHDQGPDACKFDRNGIVVDDQGRWKTRLSAPNSPPRGRRVCAPAGDPARAKRSCWDRLVSAADATASAALLIRTMPICPKVAGGISRLGGHGESGTDHAGQDLSIIVDPAIGRSMARKVFRSLSGHVVRVQPA